jgi:hypothetical protein
MGDGHEVIRLGNETAVIVPLEEYRRMREALLKTEHAQRYKEALARREAGDTIRMSAEEFIETSGLDEAGKERLRDIAAGTVH